MVWWVLMPLLVGQSLALIVPDNLILATATAAYQIEGGWNQSGKGENIWDAMVHHHPDFIRDGQNGDIACDSFHKFKEDVQLIKNVGFKMYRFSISWARFQPMGYGPLNMDAVRYYNEVINELLKNGIQPMVTLYHWDLPSRLQDLGGWVNPIMAEYFEQYAYNVFKLFGDRVKWWITINEPKEVTLGYGARAYAPALDFNGVGEYWAGHTLLLAHARAYRVYKKHFSHQGGRVSLSINGDFCIPESPEDAEAAERWNQFTFGWFGNPIYSKGGDYPEVMKQTIRDGPIRSRLPAFSQREIDLIKGTFDFFGLNHYTSKLCKGGRMGRNPSWYYDSNVTIRQDPSWPPSASSWLRVVPEGFRKLLLWIHRTFGAPEIFITENGVSDAGNTLEDEDRISFYKGYIRAMLTAMQEKNVTVLGYTTWSLMDNFEWRAGYTERFGLHYVNFTDPDRRRLPKKSVEFFRQLIATKSLDKL